MALILAIEPDRRQAARITALARNPLNVELVVTDSAERAVASIAERVPDLILTPKLLSSKDESILDARLRQLDADGRHVQTLMIPMLASGRSASRKESGLLNRLRWTSEEESSDGCDPAVFAAEIAQYLERAAAERAAKAAREEERRAPERAAEPEPRPVTERDPVPEIEMPHAVHAVPPVVEEEAAQPPADAQAALEPSFAAAPTDETWHELPLEDDEALREDQAAAAPETASPTHRAASQADELVAEFSVDPANWSPLPDAQAASSQLQASASNTLNAGPDDEWGFFDPERVGFAALIAKLQEVTE